MAAAEMPEAGLGVEIRVGQIEDGRWLAVASRPTPFRGGTMVITIGTGLTQAEALADCRNDLLSDVVRGILEGLEAAEGAMA